MNGARGTDEFSRSAVWKYNILLSFFFLENKEQSKKIQ